MCQIVTQPLSVIRLSGEGLNIPIKTELTRAFAEYNPMICCLKTEVRNERLKVYVMHTLLKMNQVAMSVSDKRDLSTRCLKQGTKGHGRKTPGVSSPRDVCTCGHRAPNTHNDPYSGRRNPRLWLVAPHPLRDS